MALSPATELRPRWPVPDSVISSPGVNESSHSDSSVSVRSKHEHPCRHRQVRKQRHHEIRFIKHCLTERSCVLFCFEVSGQGIIAVGKVVIGKTDDVLGQFD